MEEPVRIDPAPLGGEEARALITALNAELLVRYPGPGETFFSLDEEEVGPGRGAFLVARADGVPVGCGAVRRLDGTTAEIKRMYVAPAARGRRIGARILAALEAEARRLGATRLVLETGDVQVEAMALYERAGFQRIPSFGPYVTSARSVCFAKALSGPGDGAG